MPGDNMPEWFNAETPHNTKLIRNYQGNTLGDLKDNPNAQKLSIYLNSLKMNQGEPLNVLKSTIHGKYGVDNGYISYGSGGITPAGMKVGFDPDPNRSKVTFDDEYLNNNLDQPAHRAYAEILQQNTKREPISSSTGFGFVPVKKSKPRQP